MTNGSTVQAVETTYELHSLGWKAFQQLCVSIVGEIWGQTVQGYFDSLDGGRDGAFHGRWQASASETYEGSFAVQCKFTAKREKILHIADLADEIEKAARLAARGLADNYFLLSNAHVTGIHDEQIRTAFEGIPGIRRCTTFGVERISQIIRESPRLRMLVPRVYGLGDLSQILDERAYAQAYEILSALGDDLAKFVITDAYQRSARALVDHGFVLLLGEPACGKSTIAAALALGAIDEWKCSTIKVRNADDFVRHSNPHEPKQFFWVDDAFGATQLDFQSTVGWNAAFPHIQAAIRRGARVVFTSRDYIYKSARNFLKESALPVMLESRVVIKVEQLAKDEREQILYNHVRLGTQPHKFKRQLKPYLSAVAALPRFSPEIARRLGNVAFTRQLEVSMESLSNFVAHPMALLQEIIRTLDANARSAIALVFMRGGALSSPATLTADEVQALTLLGGQPADTRNALVALDGSLLIRVQQDGSHWWRFKHPTIRDAFAALVAENRELMDIYLAGTPVPQLLAEISCGDVGLTGVKVVLSPDRFDALLSRVDTLASTDREKREMMNRFLAYRCDKRFLEHYLVRKPEFLASLRVGSYLYAVSDVPVITRLHEVGLLPQPERVRHVADMRELAVETPDPGFLREDIRALFTPEELSDTLKHIRNALLPDLDRHIDDWRDNHRPDDEPEEYFSEFVSALKDYREQFDGDADAVTLIDNGLEAINTVIEKLCEEHPEPPDNDDYRGGGGTADRGDDARSIFDDVDQ